LIEGNLINIDYLDGRLFAIVPVLHTESVPGGIPKEKLPLRRGEIASSNSTCAIEQNVREFHIMMHHAARVSYHDEPCVMTEN
jgi:hypothetical protein